MKQNKIPNVNADAIEALDNLFYTTDDGTYSSYKEYVDLTEKVAKVRAALIPQPVTDEARALALSELNSARKMGVEILTPETEATIRSALSVDPVKQKMREALKAWFNDDISIAEFRELAKEALASEEQQ